MKAFGFLLISVGGVSLLTACGDENAVAVDGAGASNGLGGDGQTIDGAGATGGTTSGGTASGGTASGGTASGGSDTGTGGGAAPDCPDKDLDGISTCDGDCDDNDPTTFPGATEQCGDGIDNACGTDPDPMALCSGIGTFVSALTGDDLTGDGTQANPVKSIAQGIANAQTIGGGVDVILAEGTYNEVVSIVEGISIYGGYECNGSDCNWDFDPASHKSIISNAATPLEVDAGVSRDTLLHGVTVADPGTWSWGDLRAMTIKNCNFLSSDKNKYLELNGGLLEDSYVEGRVHLWGTGAPPDPGEMYDSRVIAQHTALSTQGQTIVRRNVLDSIKSDTVQLGGDSVFDKNLVNTDRTFDRECARLSDDCAGVWPIGTTTITNNVIFAPDGAKSSGLLVENVELAPDELFVNGNTILSAYAAVRCVSYDGQLECGEFRNNILLNPNGPSTSQTYGLVEEVESSGTSVSVDAFENNAIFGFTAIYGDWGGSSIAMLSLAQTNALSYASDNLNVDPDLDSNYRLQSGSPVIDEGTSTDAPSDDIDGEARPKGSGIDIGADEF